MNKRSKACDIPQAVKKAVWKRDKKRCIYCGNCEAMPNAHYIPRSKGGLGIEKNIVTLCRNCHYNFDQTDLRPYYKEFIQEYLKSCYKDWKKEDLVYTKWTNQVIKL